MLSSGQSPVTPRTKRTSETLAQCRYAGSVGERQSSFENSVFSRSPELQATEVLVASDARSVKSHSQ